MATQIHHSYPIFEKNQVLTHNQLNQLTSWLEEQGRLTRTGLIGIGIVCDFKLKFVPKSDSSVTKDTLFLSGGTGITSAGHLITLCDCEITKVRPYKMNEFVDYKPFQHPDTGEQDVELWELLSDDFSGDDDEENKIKPLKKSDLKNKVVLLYIEVFDKNLKSCLSKGCDEIGVERRMNVRKLLISKEELDDKVKNRTGGGKADTIFPDKVELPSIYLKRPILAPDTPATSSYIGMAMEYIKPVNEVWDGDEDEMFDMFDMLSQSYSVFEPVLADLYEENPFESDLIKQKKEEIKDYIKSFEELSEIPMGVQYLYGFVKDLLMAYEEFRIAGYDLHGICCPDPTRFPKHLMLGEAKADEPDLCDPMEYRHIFSPSPILTDRRRFTEKLKMLHKRLVLMIECVEVDRFKHQGDWVIKITPSDEKQGPLSGRSIPFYYDSKRESDFPNLGRLEDAWDYDLQRQCRPGEEPNQLSYDNNGAERADGPATAPLNYNLDPWNFYRIEGHLGKKVEEAINKIRDIKQEHNISFDVKAIHFGDSPNLNELPDCLQNDLQMQYSIWRNKILLFAKNLVKAGITAVDASERVRSEGDLSAASRGAETSESRFRTASGLNIGISDFGNFFSAGDLSQRLEASSRIYQLMALLQGRENPNAGSGEEETDGSREDDQRLRDQVSNINDCLLGLINRMPVRFTEFEMESWLEKYKCILRVFVDIMKGIAENAGDDRPQMFIAIIYLMIISAIHTLFNLLAIYPYITIRVLKDRLNQRKMEWKRRLSVSNVRSDHPGLEHKAGVAPGDTFLLVYQTVHNFGGTDEEMEQLFSSELGDVYRDHYLELVHELDEKVVGDFTLPFKCCDDCGHIMIEDEKLRPFAPPVSAVAMPNNMDRGGIQYGQVEIQLLNNLYDPDLFEPVVIGHPDINEDNYRQDVYEPDSSKTKKILIYKVNLEAVSEAKENTSSSFLIDEFEYRILDQNGEEVDRDKITIFIPLFREKEEQTAMVHGQVTENVGDNRPIVGATVIVVGENMESRTDSNGNYRIQNVPTGSRTLRASFSENQTMRVQFVEYKPQSKTVDIGPEGREVDFSLEVEFIIDVNFDNYFDAMDLVANSEDALAAARHHEAIFVEANKKAYELARDETDDDSPIKKTAKTISEFTSTHELSVVRLNNEFEKRKTELIKVILEREGDEKKKNKEALDNLTKVYLDRVSIIQPDGFTASTEKVIKGLEKLTSDHPDLKLDETVTRWQNDSSDFLSEAVKNNLTGRFGR